MRNGLGGRIIGGLVLIGIGAIFLLNQLGIIDVSLGYLFATYWPVFLILGGISQLANGNFRGSGLIGSVVLFAIGGYFLARNLDMISLAPGDFFKFFFPLALIIIGLTVLFKPGNEKKKPNADFPPAPPRPPVPPLGETYIPEMQSPLDSMFGELEKDKAKEQPKYEHEHKQSYQSYGKTNYGTFEMGGGSGGKRDTFNKSGFIGDVHLGQDYFELHPTNISHFIGDTIIDLTKAQIPYGETKINVSAFIGDVKVFIPEDMDIGITAESSAFIGDLKVLKQKQGGFMSNVQAQTPYYSEASKRVKLVVSVFIGDVKVNMVG